MLSFYWNCFRKFIIGFSTGEIINCSSLILIYYENQKVYCWTTTGEKQSQKFREQYVTAILSQEIGWFDVCGAGELSTKVAELSGKV